MPDALEDADVETSSAAYARRFEGPVGRYFLERQTQATLDLLAASPKARVLDVGGGHAQLTGPLVDQGYDVTVYGSPRSSPDRLTPWTRVGRVRFETGDLLKAPFPDRAFDAVLAYRLLPHANRWRELVHELCRLSARVVMVDYPTTRSVNAISGAFFGLTRGVEGDTRPFRVFTEGEMAGVFAEAGFRATGRRPQFFFPMALHRALGAAGPVRLLEGTAAATGLTRVFGSPVILRLERAA